MFGPNAARHDGLDPHCKVCRKEQRKAKFSYKEKSAAYNKKWRNKNKIKCSSYSKKCRDKNSTQNKTSPEKQICYICKIEKSMEEFTKDKYSPTGFTYDCNNCRAKRSAEYKRSDIGREKVRALDRRRHKKDPLPHNISSIIQRVLKENNGSKNNSSIWVYLPYTPKQLREHIEKQFELWMNWDNYGKLNNEKRTWNIDHIIPQSFLPYDSMDHPNFLKCWSLENLRPMDSKENTKKGNKVLFI